jgi:hypothetical protein
MFSNGFRAFMGDRGDRWSIDDIVKYCCIDDFLGLMIVITLF